MKTESGGRVNGGMSVRAAFGLLFFTLAVVISGCGSDSASESQIAGGEGALGRGTAAFEQKDFITAEKELSAAVMAGVLQPDLLEIAQRTRARCLIELDRCDEAELLLAELEQGAAELDQVWLVRAEMSLKLGDRSAAQSAYDQAKKLNNKLKPPVGL
ncbi:MAG: hypothetical protein JNL58_15205 [Planctomyces sp.]|nr:hypothetical protein [Planctomyces sp.]